MKKIVFIFSMVIAVIFFNSCNTSPDYSEVPELAFVGFNKNVMRQSNIDKDSITLILDFKDGDGDIGAGERDNNINLFIIDSRTNENYSFFKLPAIPEKGANNGVEGRMFINLYSTCCKFPSAVPCSVVPGFPDNKISFEVYFFDRAKNKSNVVKTPEITLLCN
jgi:hypothetical protein